MCSMLWKKQIISFLPEDMQKLLAYIPAEVCAVLEEIRLRAGQPLLLQTGAGEYLAGQRGLVRDVRQARCVAAADLQYVLLQMTEFSLYARDEELKRGYLALPGGHRAGFAGRVVLEDNHVKLLRDISAINIRIAREIKGSAEKVLPYVYCGQNKRVRHTLIVSAPQAGKTTLLRDLARLLSNGDLQAGRPGFKVGIVDERSELAGCFAGEPQLDVGMRTDVLDGCPKAEGMMMLVRSMSPQVIVTDELGKAEDAQAVEEAVNTGATVLATAHGQSAQELMRRPSLSYLLTHSLFERVIVLSRRRGPGTLEKVYVGHELGEWLRSGGNLDVD